MSTSIPVVAVCHTPEHSKWYVAQAQDVAIKAMMDPQGKVYKADLAKLLKKDVDGEEPGPSNPGGEEGCLDFTCQSGVINIALGVWYVLIESDS